MRGRTIALAAAAVTAAPLLVAAGPPQQLPRRPMAVIAHVDTGINPYHEAFRDPSPLGRMHPSTYLPGFPRDAERLDLTLDAASWDEAFEADRAIWEDLARRWEEDPDAMQGQLFWVPGTRIVGATRFSAGGVYCPVTEGVEPGPVQVHGDCADWPILDDHGHGTMTASRMAGDGSSQCPACRIVSVEGLGDESVRFLADLGVVDVQTNSWGFVVPDPTIAVLDEAFDLGIRENLETAARTHLVYFGSGNGAGFFLGFTPWPTQSAATLVEDAVWVGAHDNGKVTAWSGSPPHVVADGFQPLAAGNRDLTGVGPTPFACCTSTSSPYAASVGAATVLEARRILGDVGTGVHDGVVARGRPPARLTDGPLADGVFTLDELRALVKHSAEPRPAEGEHDGNAHWMGSASEPRLLPYGPADNPYCPGCWTAPVEWRQVPEDGPAYPLVGYGAANERSLALARHVLAGRVGAPDRSDVDAFFAANARVARVLHHPEDPIG